MRRASCTGTVLTHLHPLLPSPTEGGCIFITPFQTQWIQGAKAVLCAGQGRGTGHFVQMMILCIFMAIPLYEAKGLLQMVTRAALRPHCSQIKATAYAQTSAFPPTNIDVSSKVP